jgi:hypothetical protein
MDARPFWPRLPSEACTAKKLKRAVCASERTAPHQQPALLHARVRSQSPRFCRPIAKNITLVSTSIYVRSGVHSSEVASCRGAAVLFFLRSISIDQLAPRPSIARWCSDRSAKCMHAPPGPPRCFASNFHQMRPRPKEEKVR